MRILKSMRWMMLAMLLPFLAVTAANAEVFISVRVAPPVLPVYEQPPCPEPGLMWTPGYWAYDYDAQSYYWVPGAWVPAPYEGALWTPPYWGWQEGVYAFHPGYWGWHVGYYGGVNYGFGYMGIGFVGGEWHEHEFAYNTAVMRVNTTVIHNTYVNETVIHNTTIVNNHVAYAGGPGGVQHQPTQEERVAMQERHVAPTQYQQQHFQQAKSERANFYNVNHGRPQTVAIARPLPAARVTPPPAPPAMRTNAGANANMGARGNNANVNGNARGGVQNGAAQRPMTGNEGNQRPGNESRRAPGGIVQAPSQRNEQQVRPQPQARPEPQGRSAEPQYRPAPQQQSRPEPQYRPAPQQQSRPEPQYRPAPEPRPQPQARPEPQYRPAPEPRPQPQARPEPQYRPAPQSRPEARPAPAPREQSRPAPKEAPREKEKR